MKIAVVGAHSCGKTTLAYLLAAEYKKKDKSVQIITEGARRCPFTLGTLESSRWILLNTLKEELEGEKGHEIIICDRSTLDALVYCEASGFRLPDYLETLAREHMKTYDRVIHLAPSRPIVDDGFRFTAEDYREKVAGIFRRELGEGLKFTKEDCERFIRELEEGLGL